MTFVVVLAALALTGWGSARISQIQSMVPMVRTVGSAGLSMLITYFAGHLLYPSLSVTATAWSTSATAP